MIRSIAAGLIMACCAWGQTDANRDATKEAGSGREIGSGAGTIGTGAARGARDLAKGTARGAVSLATLHPIDAGVSFGKGIGAAGKDVTVGTVKGTGKIGKGVGKAIKRVF